MMTSDPDGGSYFLYHSIGQYRDKARDMAQAMAEFAAVWGRADDLQWPYALGVRQRFIDRWRAILGAADGTVTTAESVTAALSALIGGLPDTVLRGRRVLVAGDCFPSVHFLLAGLQASRGFVLDTVPMRQGSPWVEDEDIVARWGADVGLALLTWISSTTSHRSDLAPLVAHGRRMGSLIGVDITQGAGLLPFDVGAPMIDFALSTSLKWMCGSPGAGILYANPALIARSQPTLRGWFSQPDPFNWDFDRFSLAPDIRRFDHGTPGIMAAAASLPALDWHAAEDQNALVAHNRTLSALVQDGVNALGLPLVSPAAAKDRGGSVMALLPADCPAPEIIAGLRRRDIAADARGRTLRLSPGVLTTADGVTHLLETLTDLLQRP